MTPTRTGLFSSNISHRGVSLVLIVAGGLLLRAKMGTGASLGQYLIGAVMLAVGAGVWRFHRWARWMALGACFLGLLGAIVFTFHRFLTHPWDGLDGSFRFNLAVSVFALAIAVVGYQGLSYLRSERGRIDFAGDAASQEDLLNERSSAVAFSALVWVVLALISWYPRQFSPTRLYHALTDRPRQQRAQREDTNKPVSLVLLRGQNSLSMTPTPDLIPIGLCYRDQMLERVVYVVYTSAGGFPDRTPFRAGISKDFDTVPQLLDATLTVPKRDTLGFAEIARESDMPRGKFLVHLDLGNVIRERDEDNNSAQYEMPVESPGLPECGRVKKLYGWRDGPTITTATVRRPGQLPDLVPLGICTRGRYSIGMQFTNRGKKAESGHFVISQGRSIEELEVKENLLHSVPEMDEPRGFNIGTPYDVFGKVAGTYEYFVKLDPSDTFEESNEMNNVASASFTIRSDGTIDLPDCDALAAKAADHDWVADEVMLQPAFVALPDLVPLGLCVKDWGAGSRYLQIVYGNIGNVKSPEPVRIDIADAPKARSNYVERFRVPTPGYVALAGTSRRVDEARGVESISVDSAHALIELSESNNTARFVLPVHRDDPSLGLPNCDSVGGRVSDWIGKMTALAGPE